MKYVAVEVALSYCCGHLLEYEGELTVKALKCSHCGRPHREPLSK